MERRTTIAALIVLVAGAGACTPQKQQEVRRKSLQVDVHLDVPSLKPKEGQLAGVVFTVHNPTDRVFLLRELTLDGAPDAQVTWQFARPGKIEFIIGANEWTFRPDPDSTEPPRPIFNSGMLVPGEGFTFRMQ